MNGGFDDKAFDDGADDGEILCPLRSKICQDVCPSTDFPSGPFQGEVSGIVSNGVASLFIISQIQLHKVRILEETVPMMCGMTAGMSWCGRTTHPKTSD